jgi:hypothetical protein
LQDAENCSYFASRNTEPPIDNSIGPEPGERLDRFDIGAGEDLHGDLPAESGAGKGSEIAGPIGSAPAIGSEPPATSKGARGGEIGLAGLVAQCRQCVGSDRVVDAFGDEPGADFGQRLAASVERLRPLCGIGRVVEQAGAALALDQNTDQGFRLPHGF